MGLLLLSSSGEKLSIWCNFICMPIRHSSTITKATKKNKRKISRRQAVWGNVALSTPVTTSKCRTLFLYPSIYYPRSDYVLFCFSVPTFPFFVTKNGRYNHARIERDTRFRWYCSCTTTFPQICVATKPTNEKKRTTKDKSSLTWRPFVLRGTLGPDCLASSMIDFSDFHVITFKIVDLIFACNQHKNNGGKSQQQKN